MIRTAFSFCFGAVLLAAASAHAEGVAYGLIVKLKDAPSHRSLREKVQSTDPAMQAAAQAESQRLEKVLRESVLDRAALPPTLRPTGRAAQLVQFERPLSAARARQLAQRLRQRGDVEWVVPNEREQRLQVPDDPMFAGFDQQWWLQPVSGTNANALDMRLRGVPGFQAAWVRERGLAGSAAARVAVLDTGITSHPDLDGRWVGGYDFVSDVPFANDGDGRDADPADPGDWVSAADLADPVFQGCAIQDSSNWHGTIIAGQIAAQTDNGAGVAAINWNGRIVPVRVAGKCGATVADIVDGMRWAAGLPVAGVPDNPHPARVINISFGGSAACNEAYRSAIDEIRAEKGALLVAAAGNEFGPLTRPASCAGAIAVAALNRDGFKATYSNFGPGVTLSTVGGDNADGAWYTLADGGLLTLFNHGAQGPGQPGYAYLTGTSFAAPLVAGTASLMLAANPGLTAAQIIEGLRASARPHVTSPRIGVCSDSNPGRCICTTSTCGAGILDAEQALIYATNPAAYVPPVRQPAVIDNADIDAAVAVSAQDRVVPTGGDDDDGGGGGMGFGWIAGVMAAVVALHRRRLRERLA